MEEEWKQIIGYEDRYEISNLGNVRSLDRLRWNGKVWYRKAGQKRAKYIRPNGYEAVSLKADGKTKTFYVHRLVAEAFIPNPENLPTVNHKDENKAKNNADNLEWCTYSYNNTYNGKAKRVGLTQRGTYPTRKKVKCLETGEVFCSISEAARSRSVPVSSISNYLAGRLKTGGGYRWEVI